ncbi:glycopeptide antibiotics resistance protein [Desulfosporosinus orientis DSM 765]|uniref:Glycopeptide antibiotics resistance protein n=1 Tax=Desulfosporosinus orientis (strain ATCC 19365 / DSM 765 / NCIMB 8382 / VKM B-1628 / Singapore I) TaxID=768706 RepID=G7WBU1_DESOD|nr:glycopeptide resistance protein VanZ-A [Desulfosporosinus orientis]AET69338.1 glycopeptide antibiotics resistance protein [Desulfosporosinus orientis DSM 765]
MGKILSRGLLALYLVILIWLVLFKLQYNIFSVFNYHHRSLNLNPFAPLNVNGRINFGEMIDNVMIFIPFGLLLNVNFKKVGFIPKFALILVFSLTCELIQFIFAIGATDITDVITNTVGGFLGLELYSLSNRYINNKILDRVIIFVGTLLLVLLLYYRFHILRLKY